VRPPRKYGFEISLGEPRELFSHGGRLCKVGGPRVSPRRSLCAFPEISLPGTPGPLFPAPATPGVPAFLPRPLSSTFPGQTFLLGPLFVEAPLWGDISPLPPPFLSPFSPGVLLLRIGPGARDFRGPASYTPAPGLRKGLPGWEPAWAKLSLVCPRPGGLVPCGPNSHRGNEACLLKVPQVLLGRKLSLECGAPPR